MPSEVLFPVFERRGKMPPPDLVFCGDDGRAKKTVARLIRGAGFHPFDLGGLEAARLIEPFTLVIANVAYRPRTNGRLAYRFERPRARR
jgi:predicted dinucleotide-binding enzyme